MKVLEGWSLDPLEAHGLIHVVMVDSRQRQNQARNFDANLQGYIRANLVNPVCDRKDIYILTGNQWKEYQRLLRNREEGLIGYPIE